MSGQIAITSGALVAVKNEEFIITHILDLETVLAKSVETGETARLRIENLSLPKPMTDKDEEEIREMVDYELTLITETDWEEANRRFNLIRPLLIASRRTTEMVRKVAEAAEVHIVTIYRWIAEFERTGKVSALLPTKRAGGRGQSRLQPETEEIMRTTIENFYLSKQQRSVGKTIREIERLCRNANITAPHSNTIRRRIAAISDEKKIARRIGARAARQRFSPFVDHFPGADFPLSVVQIDHTKLDIMVVDEVHRLSVGRPCLTVAIDVYSRMVLGFYVSLDPPSAMSVGLCLSHAFLPKEKWLTQIGIEKPWACWGFPGIVHADNAKEFRGDMLRRACQEYGIDLVWRPVATPHWGAHIERLMGTFAEEVHALPGTTFSNIEDRGDYDSEAQAVMTLPELEKWLATYITGVYHQKFRNALMMSPVKKFEQGILGSDTQPGIGLPPRIADEDKLRFDFMPFVDRTVQGYGVAFEEIHYYSDVLRPFINSYDPVDPRLKRRFIFRYDPRNLREIYFYHPDFKHYFAIPYRNTSRPPISIWDLKKVRRILRDKGYESVDENLIFDTYNELREQEELASKKTRSARRSTQRRAYHEQVQHPAKSYSEINSDVTNQAQAPQLPANIVPFEEIEKL